MNSAKSFKRQWIGLGLLAAALAGGCGPVWIIDPSYAERLAKEKNRPLFLYFKSWDSTQHRNMRLQVFADARVAKEMTDTINTELEYAFFPDYRARYGVKEPQVCVMCAPDRSEVGKQMKVDPVPTPEKFLEWLRASKAAAMGPPGPLSPPSAAPRPAPGRK